MVKHLLMKLDQLIRLLTDVLAALQQIESRLPAAKDSDQDNPDEDVEYISMKEAARMFGFTVRSFARWNKSGLYPAIYIGGHPFYVLKELVKWFRERKSRKSKGNKSDDSKG